MGHGVMFPINQMIGKWATNTELHRCGFKQTKGCKLCTDECNYDPHQNHMHLTMMCRSKKVINIRKATPTLIIKTLREYCKPNANLRTLEGIVSYMWGVTKTGETNVIRDDWANEKRG